MTSQPVAPTEGDKGAVRARQSDLVYWAVFLLVAVRSWLMPLGSSFWLDETGTFWLIKGGPSEILSRSIHWVGTSLVYGWVAFAGYMVGGHNEIALRLPSVVAMAFAALLLYRLAARLWSQEAAWPTVLIFLSLDGVAYAAVDARPYACALLTLIGATLLLVRWMDTDRFVFALGYAVLASLTLYLQVLFLAMFLSHVLYVIYRLRTGAAVRWITVFGAVLIGGVMLIPELQVLLRLKHSAVGLSGAHRASLQEVFEQLIPPVLSAGLLFGAVLSRGVVREFRVFFRRMDSDAALLVLSWWILTILVLFGVSYLTPIKIFFRRYLLQATPGLALFFGWAVSGIERPNARALTVSVLALLGLLNNTGTHMWPFHGGEDWRGAMAAVRSIVHDKDCPVVVASSFIEGANPAKYPEITPTSYLLAPLSMYPVEGRIIPVPYRLDENSRPFIEQSTRNLEGSSRFVLVTRGEVDMANHALANSFRARYASLGFQVTDLGLHGVNVFLFEKR
jgi:hypothetical protein